MQSDSFIFNQHLKSIIIDSIRNFFKSNDFLEVFTPVLANELIPESTIDTFSLKDKKNNVLYLVPSPEIYMKRMVSYGFDRIFQITPVFRDDEKGNHHWREFLMLEWYSLDTDYKDLMKNCQEIIFSATTALKNYYNNNHTPQNMIMLNLSTNFPPPFREISIKDAFLEHEGWIPAGNFSIDRYYDDFILKVEENRIDISKKIPVFLTGFPQKVSPYSKPTEENTEFTQRVELYINGIEIANGWTEVLDAEFIKNSIISENNKRLINRLNSYPQPENFLNDIKNIKKPYSGMAMGIDRLLMALTGCDDISEVMPFVNL